jgi:CRP-like cAMP-binding protein
VQLLLALSIAFARILEDNATVTYVLLDTFPTLLNSAPKTVLDVIRAMNADMLKSQTKVSFSFVDGLTQDNLVPLAATLIGYPVAYVPISADQTSFLSGQPLNVYEAIVVPGTPCASSLRGSNQPHSLLKFSCPRLLAETNRELSPERVTKRLQSQFRESLSSIELSLLVHHHVEVMDRVAL